MALSSDLQIRYQIQAFLLDFDATLPDSHQIFYKQLQPKPDVVVSVFGYLGDQECAEANFDEARKIIDTNFTGNVSILNIIANDFEQRKAGTIIGFSSVAGERGRQSNYVYGASKAAFSVYLDGMRNRLFKAGVHVITVKPGFVTTQMTAHLALPALLTATPQQVAAAVYKGFKNKTNTIYVLAVWRYIMLIIACIPEFFFKKLKL